MNKLKWTVSPAKGDIFLDIIPTIKGMKENGMRRRRDMIYDHTYDGDNEGGGVYNGIFSGAILKRVDRASMTYKGGLDGYINWR